MENTKKYTGSCFIGVVGSENEIGTCRDSIDQMERGPKDELSFIRATKGYEARQMHLNNWYEKTKHPFLLLLDSDMIFPPYTLARLRSHKRRVCVRERLRERLVARKGIHDRGGHGRLRHGAGRTGRDGK